MTFLIKTNDRVLLAGKTGSGKTWWAEHLLNRTERLVVVDSKGSLGHWRLDEPGDRDWHAFGQGEPGRYRIKPPISDNPQAYYEELFEKLYYIGNLIVYMDEAYFVTPPGARPGKWLSALYTRGRELGIGTWSSTQRPAWIPGFLISEADVLVVFRLQLPEDRKKLAGVGGEEMLIRVPDPHGFYLYRLEDEEPTYYESLELDDLKMQTSAPA